MANDNLKTPSALLKDITVSQPGKTPQDGVSRDLVETGESRTPRPENYIPGLVMRLLDQLTKLGCTAAQIKKALKTKSLEI